jgi:hypothetical protein
LVLIPQHPIERQTPNIIVFHKPVDIRSFIDILYKLLFGIKEPRAKRLNYSYSVLVQLVMEHESLYQNIGNTAYDRHFVFVSLEAIRLNFS